MAVSVGISTAAGDHKGRPYTCGRNLIPPALSLDVSASARQLIQGKNCQTKLTTMPS